LTSLRRAINLRSMRSRSKRVTVNLPLDVLESATKVTGKGITATILEGLRALESGAKRSALRSLKGKIRFDLEQARR
jgi:hypothetical protein